MSNMGVGETRKAGTLTLKAVESNKCHKCYFFERSGPGCGMNNADISIFGSCVDIEREDQGFRGIIFKAIRYE